MKKLLCCLFIAISLFLGDFCFAQSTTNIVVQNGFKITTIVEPVGANVIIPTITQSNPSISTTNETTVAITNLLKAEGYSTNAEKISSIFLDDFINQLPYYKNKAINFDVAPLYNFSQHTLGYFYGIDIPTAASSSLGFGMLTIGKQLDILPLSFKTGLNIDWWGIGEVYNFVGVGSAYDYTDDKLGTYTTLGGVKTFALAKSGFWKNWTISIGVGISDVSTYQGIDVNGVFRIHTQF